MNSIPKWLPVIFAGVPVIVGLITIHQITPKTTDSKPELQAIQRAIEHVPTPKIDLSPIRAEVAELVALIQQRKDSDAASFNTLVNDIKTELASKFENIEATIASIENKAHVVKLLPASSLPFKVLSIDSLQHVGVATVAYGFKTTALEVGDSLAGWKVQEVDFAKQQMVLSNDEGEVRLQLNRGEAYA